MSAAEITDAVITSFRETDLITWIATASAVIYVILALRENIWCWSFGILGSALSIGVYITQELYYESLLSFFYVVLGVYGWVMWSRRNEKTNLPVVKISAAQLIAVCVTGVMAGGLMGFISDYLTDADFTYLDAMLTSFSVLATWMTAKKILENWIFWVVIDAVSAVLYFVKGPEMYLFALLFIFYTFMAVGGYFAWRKNLRA